MIQRRTAIMLLIIIGLIAFPLLFESKAVSAPSSDDQGPAWILSTGYIPWVHPLWEPPNSDMEAGLFALQAALGAGIMGYIFGMWHAQSRMKKKEENSED
jgi:cobalt/nickel transport protein